jgi:hypothetical protein
LIRRIAALSRPSRWLIVVPALNLALAFQPLPRLAAPRGVPT